MRTNSVPANTEQEQQEQPCERLQLDLVKHRYSMDVTRSSSLPTPQLDALRKLYKCEMIEGCTSAPCKLDTKDSKGMNEVLRRRMMLPADKGMYRTPTPRPAIAVNRPTETVADCYQLSLGPLKCATDLYDCLGATHFVWAYQLEKWNAGALSTEEMGLFEKDSGEISLASLGENGYLAPQLLRQQPWHLSLLLSLFLSFSLCLPA